MAKHSAPPVIFPIRRASIQSLALLGLWLSALLVSVEWIHSAQVVDWRTALSLSAVLASGLVLLHLNRRSRPGDLVWDGLNWRFQGQQTEWGGDATEQSIKVIFDFQYRIVLKAVDDAGCQHWAVAQRDDFPERWLDFRRAVYCSRKAVLSATPIHTTATADAPPVALSTDDQGNDATRIAA